MRLAGRVLSTGMSGGDVSELHTALEALDFFLPCEETRRSLFGPGTRKAVVELQREHFKFASRITGIVDQATANLIQAQVGRYAA